MQFDDDSDDVATHDMTPGFISSYYYNTTMIIISQLIL